MSNKVKTKAKVKTKTRATLTTKKTSLPQTATPRKGVAPKMSKKQQQAKRVAFVKSLKVKQDQSLVRINPSKFNHQKLSTPSKHIAHTTSSLSFYFGATISFIITSVAWYLFSK